MSRELSIVLFGLFVLGHFQAESKAKKIDQHLVLGQYKLSPKEFYTDKPEHAKFNGKTYEKREKYLKMHYIFLNQIPYKTNERSVFLIYEDKKSIVNNIESVRRTYGLNISTHRTHRHKRDLNQNNPYTIEVLIIVMNQCENFTRPWVLISKNMFCL